MSHDTASRMKVMRTKLYSLSRAAAYPMLGLLLAFLVGTGIIVAVGADPSVAYGALLKGAFGSARALSETIVRSVPLMLVGLGIVVAFRCRVWNIGAEGQLLIGATAATVLGLWLSGAPAALLLPLVVVGSFAAGGLWGLIPGLLRARLGINIVISTLMMNYIATLLVSYLLLNPLRDPTAGGVAITPVIGEGAILPTFTPDTRLHTGLLLAIVCAFLVYGLLWRTTVGYRIRVVGCNPRAARYAGISVAQSIVITMFISGGLAGLAGMVEVSGVHHRLIQGFSPGYGFAGITVALLAGLNPFGVLATSTLFGALVVGADKMARTAEIPIALVQVIQGMIVLFVLALEVLGQRRKGASVDATDA